MKKIFFLISLLSISFSLFADSSGLSEARELAQMGVIVDQSTMAQSSPVSTSLNIQESAMYRLSDFIIRQEVLGMALKLKGVDLPSGYSCRDFYRDTGEWWVCRAAELSADYGIVTRANLYFRPRDVLTFAEALGITIKALDIPLSNTPTTIIQGNIPDWQKRIFLTIKEEGIMQTFSGPVAGSYVSHIIHNNENFFMNQKITRGQFFQIVITLLNHQASSDPTAHCTVYNDGCNDCVRGDEGIACTKRACIWQGIPSCSECENGYTLQNGKCIMNTGSCKKLGEAVSNFSLPPEYQFSGTCCSGLTSVAPKDGGVGGSNICANVGDYVCDSRYESEHNSPDCRLVMGGFDSSICQSYYDGCNSCSNTSDGNTMCTMRYCEMPDGPAYCRTYKTYVPINQTADQQFSDKVLNEIQNYTKDLSCTSSAQCNWKLFGSNPCGSSSTGIRYSSKNIDMTLFENKTTYYTNMQTLFNQTYPVFGTCAVMALPPPLSCVNGMCQ